MLTTQHILVAAMNLGGALPPSECATEAFTWLIQAVDIPLPTALEQLVI